MVEKLTICASEPKLKRIHSAGQDTLSVPNPTC
jgi:hypothetical protein